MATEVVYLRSVRDQLIGSTPVGKMIVDGFNRFYYSWSPQVSQLIAPNQILRGLFRGLLTPIIWIVSVTALIFNLVLDLTRNGDAASVMAFLTAAIITTSFYIGLPILAIVRILAHMKVGHSAAGSRRTPRITSHRRATRS